MLIGKQFTFQAAHHLPDHDGKCRHPHGHSYRAEVVLQGPLVTEGPKRGMVVDFGDVKAVWDEHLHPILDHRDLNESLAPFHVDPTTAENIAGFILVTLREHIPEVDAVRVWETETSWAEASRW